MNGITFGINLPYTNRVIMKATGIILIIIGLVLTIFTTFKFFTKEKIVDLGKVEITTEKPHEINWSPLIGIAVMGIGGVVLWQASKKK
jgi:cytochrome c biogenesis protein CcdA